jgi:menaquinol-cytochrome c reductase iron-sulfur subunit
MPNGSDKQNAVTAASSRRRFLTFVGLIFGAIGAGIAAIPPVAFFVGPAFVRRNNVWRAVGAVKQFKIGSTVLVSFENAGALPWDGQTALTAAWLRREGEQEFIAFSVNCTHLGCPVRWDENANLFLCPCHGGVYHRNGQVAGGPPPRALTHYAVRVREGQVEIETHALPI